MPKRKQKKEEKEKMGRKKQKDKMINLNPKNLKQLQNLFPDNKLNLEILAEEASEIIQAKSKIIRFGLTDVYNNTNKPDQSNVEKLEEEVGQFLAVVDVLIANGILRPNKLSEVKPIKWAKMVKWNQYKGTQGDF